MLCEDGTMADTFTKAKRREIMQAIRRERTAPEAAVAKMLRSLKLRFRRQCSHLPGRPDFYLPAAKTVIFVNGCFWHGHKRCRKGRNRSKSNRRYWEWRIDLNMRRD